jgi:riboflavin-specific deaminase-like protein
MQRLLPDPAPIEPAELLAEFEPVALAGKERPYVFTNFAVTVDGHATIAGRSGSIGSDTDTAMLMGLRARADAVMIGAGTMRAENYGRLLPDAQARARRERIGLPHDPLAVIISNRMELPWDAGLFTCGAGRVLIFTAVEDEPPATSTPVRVERHPGGVDLPAALRHLRAERGIRGLLCEGGPRLHAELLAAGLVDELFLTIAPKLAGGSGPRIVEGALPGESLDLELRWLLADGPELFARYAVSG